MVYFESPGAIVRCVSFIQVFLLCTLSCGSGLPGGSDSKEAACNAGDLGLMPGLERSPGGGQGNHSNILAWRIPWTEESGGLQSLGSQKSQAKQQC